MKKIKLVSILMLSALTFLSGCSGEEDSFSPIIEKPGSLVLINDESEEIFYFLVESETATLILWTPTIDENTPRIPANSSISVEYKDIYGVSETSREVIFYWWNSLATTNNQVVAANIQSRVIQL